MGQHSWKVVRNPIACMDVLQSMWKGLNHCWNFMDSESESATYPVTQLFDFAISRSCDLFVFRFPEVLLVY